MTGRARLLLLALVFSLPGGLRAEDRSSPATLQARVHEVLEKSEERPAEDTARELAAIDPRIAPVLFHTLEQTYLSPGRERSREPLLAAFRFLPERAVSAWAQVAAGEDASLDARLLLLRALREAGGAWAVEPALAVAQAIGPRYLTSPHVGHQVTGALVASLEADPKSYAAVVRAWPRLEAGLREAVLRAVQKADPKRAVGCLCRLLAADHTSPAEALDLLARIPGVGPGSLDPTATSLLRALLRDARPGVRKPAVLLVGRVHDAHSAEDLVGLLEDADALVRNAAVRSLRRMCGISLIASPARWKQWLAGERKWLAEEKDRDLEVAKSGKKRRALLALHSLGRRRLHREQVVGGVAAALKRDDAEIRAAACRALGSLGSPSGVDALLAALGDADETVRREAHAALGAATGLASEATEDGWRAKLSASIASPR